MAGSIFGDLFRVSTFGESHGKGLGVVIDGCPAGVPLLEDVIMEYMDRRKPGSVKYSTPRKESDKVEILSGVFEGRTTGTPIAMVVYNEDHHSKDYSEIASYYRPGHADYTYDMKYGFRDYRGGGRSSGRETLARVAGGAVALSFLKELGIEVKAYIKSIAGVDSDKADCEVPEDAEKYLDELKKDGDSAGGVIECTVKNLPAGIGEPVFDKLDAVIAGAIMSIGAVKGVEFGNGFAAADSTGSANNDSFYAEAGKLLKKTNNAGGVLGGISDGSNLVFRAAFKPTPSIGKTQQTVNKNLENIDINIKGRHDPVIVPRAVVVVEAMTGLAIADLLLKNMSSKLSDVKKIYLT